MDEDDENLINNEKHKKQLLIFSKKIEEIISEYKNRKKFGIPKLNEHSLQKVDLQQYNDFFERLEEQKNILQSYKLKLNNDFKFTEITQKENELKYLEEESKIKEKEYQYLLKSNKRLDGYQNNLLNEEIDYYKEELKKLKNEFSILNNRYANFKNEAEKIRKENNNLEKEYDLIQKNIEFKIDLNKNERFYKEIITDEQIETESETSRNIIKTVENTFQKIKLVRDNLENEVVELRERLSKYKYDSHINDLKVKEIQKIENELKLNQINQKKKIISLKKFEEKERRKKSEQIKNLMAESLKSNFPFKNNNYKLLLEEEKKQKVLNFNKFKLNIAKNKMSSSRSSIDIFNTKREQIKRQKEKEKEEFMKNLGKELKEHEEKKEELIQDIKSLKDDIEKSLELNKINDVYLDNIKKEKAEENNNHNK